MSDINAPIPYRWNLGWGSGVCGKPIVNPLLKAVIESDIAEMDRLAALGATLHACDANTLRRVLHHKVTSYVVMKWLLRHGLSRVDPDPVRLDAQSSLCPNGYSWGLIGRAYYLKAYEVMDLLAAHGFREFYCYDPMWSDGWEADKHILRNGDERGLKILLENGYVFEDSRFYRPYFQRYVMERPQVRRKSIGLDFCNTGREVPLPAYERVPLIFGRREAQARNARLREDYEDRVRARREFLQCHGK